MDTDASGIPAEAQQQLNYILIAFILGSTSQLF
jgi:hypothetical protein